MVIGGLIGTLPDLDVLVQYSDAVASFTYHRSWSHSLIVLALVSPLLAWLFHRFYPQHNDLNQQRATYTRWFACVFLTLTTHPLLDGFTIYGTQLLWPMPVEPIAWGSIFIIDPLYTLPLIIGLWFAWKNRQKARSAILIALMLSTSYLLLTVYSQQQARQIALAALKKQSLGTSNVLIAPAPFAVLWRIVSMDGDTYHEGFYSLFDSTDEVNFVAYKSNRHLIDQHHDHWPVARLDWFTGGMISATKEQGQLIVNDLRMGVEANYVFRFVVGQWSASEFEPLESAQLPLRFDSDRVANIVKRVWDESVDVGP